MNRYHTPKKPTPTPVTPALRSPLKWLLPGFLLVIGVAGVSYFIKQWHADTVQNTYPLHQTLSLPKETTRLLTPTQTPATTAQQPSDEQLPALALEETTFVLPVLTNSDAPVKEALVQLSSDLEQWLSTPQLIKAYLTVINDFSQGDRIQKHMSFLRLNTAFSAESDGTAWQMSTLNYQRYDSFVQAIDAVNAHELIKLYQHYRPLLTQVFSEFSYPEHYQLEDIINKAAAELLAAPVITTPILLSHSSVMYKYQDARLEALKPTHKQMLRMGPKNTQTLQHKIREIVQELANTSP